MKNFPSGSALLLSRHFVRHRDELTGKTLRELATMYGVTAPRMRTVLRTAREDLRRVGLVVTVPIREDGYVIVVSDKLAVVLHRVLYRINPIITEIIRHDEDIRTVNKGVSLMNELISALFDTAANIGDIVLDDAAV